MNFEFELKSNFEVRKLDISKLKKNRVTLDISKIECRETGGKAIFKKWATFQKTGQK